MPMLSLCLPAHSGLECEKCTIFGSFFTNTLSSGLMRFLINTEKKPHQVRSTMYDF